MNGKKTGGRVKGTPNKQTQFTRDVIQRILTDYQDSGLMNQDLSGLEPKDRLDVMVKLMSFITPKPQAIDMTLTAKTSLTIEDTLQRLAQENENDEA